MKMVDKFHSVFAFVACAVATVAVAGCAVSAEPEPTSASESTELTRTYDGVTVVAAQAADGTIRVEPKSANGDALMALVVRGERIEIEPLADRTLVPWTGAVPVETKTELEGWTYVAYAYSQHIEAPAQRGADGQVRPQMMSAGTDGQMCIAAGGTAMECAYWRYCRSNWCPFW